MNPTSWTLDSAMDPLWSAPLESSSCSFRAAAMDAASCSAKSLAPSRCASANVASDAKRSGKIWGVPSMGVPPNGWFIRENPIKANDLGEPQFQELSI